MREIREMKRRDLNRRSLRSRRRENVAAIFTQGNTLPENYRNGSSRGIGRNLLRLCSALYIGFHSNCPVQSTSKPFALERCCGIFDFGTPKRKYRNILFIFASFVAFCSNLFSSFPLFPSFPQLVVKSY
jgi:hypothetical protein